MQSANSRADCPCRNKAGGECSILRKIAMYSNDENPDTQEITIDHVEDLLGDLRMVARRLLMSERQGISVQPTSLVLSALRRQKGKDMEWDEVTWENRRAFFGAMHHTMRRALVDYARKRNAQKRPSLEYLGGQDIEFYNLRATVEERPEQIIALEEALDWLEESDAERAEIVRHHYFTGSSVQEIAGLLESSERTVKRRLREARILLNKKILAILAD